MTTQFILPTAAAWTCQQMILFFTNGRMRPLLHEGFQSFCPVFEIFAASPDRGIAGRSRLSLCTPQKSVDHWECVFDHPAHRQLHFGLAKKRYIFFRNDQVRPFLHEGFHLFFGALKFLERRWASALPKDRVCHFAQSRNRSTAGNAFLTTQFCPADSCDLDLPKNDALFYQCPNATLPPWRILVFLSVFEIFTASPDRCIAGGSRLSLCAPQKSVDRWGCVFDHPVHPADSCGLDLPKNDTFFYQWPNATLAP